MHLRNEHIKMSKANKGLNLFPWSVLFKFYSIFSLIQVLFHIQSYSILFPRLFLFILFNLFPWTVIFKFIEVISMELYLNSFHCHLDTHSKVPYNSELLVLKSPQPPKFILFTFRILYLYRTFQ